ncbi:MAG: NAD(P)/FAD-dependent oxidoreductase [Anaerolineae bacterium]|nr:NAD(P)/FAD-dependent oxidoreductase [Anaerolineae bacterium]
MQADERTDLAIIGAGAAGLMAAIWAGRQVPGRRIVLLDGAKKPGAKILVSGGGRCNVTHDVVTEHAYAGSTPHAIRKVLRRFDVPRTVAFFQDIGVLLKREDMGKLFPVTDSARTVLDALFRAARAAGAELWYPFRVESVERAGVGFHLSGPAGTLHAGRVVLATGGRSLPKSGSDGQAYMLARGLGHSISHTFPALVPLTLPRRHFICGLSGLPVDATLEVQSGSGKRLESLTGAILCTHFGLSGPAVLDISRHYLAARFDDPAARLLINWLPGETFDSLEQSLLHSGSQPLLRLLSGRLPDRLARALCAEAGIDTGARAGALTREARRGLVHLLVGMPLPVSGDRGFTYAEVTAGGVPLSEVHLETMESRVCPGLYLCGEICDVDGRIGGYNFQWAWSSGYVAGVSA